MNHNLHDYILYGHTFASALEKQSLAQEDAEKQLNNRLRYDNILFLYQKQNQWEMILTHSWIRRILDGI